MSHALFEPITLRSLTVRNRLWVSPMCQYAAVGGDGMPTDWHLVHYGGLAAGGAGAVVLEATGVSPEGRITPRCLGLWNDAQQHAFERITAFAHAQGAAVGVQLIHAGRKASTWPEWGFDRDGHPLKGTVPEAEGGWPTVAPSAIPFGDCATPRALDEAGIDAVVDAFAQAARRAVAAGFDLVELHGAHGYLVHQFLSPLSNRRDDAYGGSLAGRARLLLRIVDAVREAVGPDVPVIARLSATDWVDGGLTAAETIQVARWLSEHGVDLVDMSTGGNTPSAPIPAGPGYQVRFAAQVRRETGMPVSTVGMILNAAQAEQVLVSGQADVVTMGRALLRDPNLPLRASRELRHPVPAPGPCRRAW